MDMRPLVIRADASPQMGLGHVMRCLALAQAWISAGGTVVWAGRDMPASLLPRLESEHITLRPVPLTDTPREEAQWTAQLAVELGAEWAAVDGYHFGRAYLETLRSMGLQVLRVDDDWNEGWDASDIFLNGNVYAEEPPPPAGNPVKSLLGPRYALLRSEFHVWRSWTRECPASARTLLVTLGGGDPAGVEAVVLDALLSPRPVAFETRILVGPASPSWARLSSRTLPSNISLASPTSDMGSLLAWADMGITGAGSTCLESAFMGLPFLGIVLADNQRRVAEGFSRAGAALDLGWHAQLDPRALRQALDGLAVDSGRRQSMSIAGRALVDGFGPERVIHELCGQPLFLRPAASRDCRQVYEWANDPLTRSMSFSKAPIPWESHVAWFDRKLRDPGSRIYLAEGSDGSLLGQIRFDPTDTGDLLISIIVSPAARGRGIGTSLIAEGLRRMVREQGRRTFHAWTLETNHGSIKAFVKNRFRLVETTEEGGARFCHYVLTSDEIHPGA